MILRYPSEYGGLYVYTSYKEKTSKSYVILKRFRIDEKVQLTLVRSKKKMPYFFQTSGKKILKATTVSMFYSFEITIIINDWVLNENLLVTNLYNKHHWKSWWLQKLQLNAVVLRDSTRRSIFVTIYIFADVKTTLLNYTKS